MSKKRKSPKKLWWPRHPLWRIRFQVNQFCTVASVMKDIPDAPQKTRGIRRISNWQWRIQNPDFAEWIPRMLADRAGSMIINLVKNLQKAIAENRKALARTRIPRGLSAGWRNRCIGAAEWFASLFPEKSDDAHIVFSFVWVSRNPWSYQQVIQMAHQINLCWVELVTAKGLRGEAMDSGPHPTVQAALEYIKQNPGRGGAEIAKAIGVTPEHFRSRIVPQLKETGVVNEKGRGYRIKDHPPRSAM
jgi:hypothetical protein